MKYLQYNKWMTKRIIFFSYLHQAHNICITDTKL